MGHRGVGHGGMRHGGMGHGGVGHGGMRHGGMGRPWRADWAGVGVVPVVAAGIRRCHGCTVMLRREVYPVKERKVRGGKRLLLHRYIRAHVYARMTGHYVLQLVLWANVLNSSRL